MEIFARNVNDAFHQAAWLMMQLRGAREQGSRNGTTIEFDEPVFTHYSHPDECVLFSPARDANPFFHLFEALWMLAGRQDVEFPAHLVKRMAEYSDDGRTMQGAYGYRWRKFFGFDQIESVIKTLSKDPDSRRAVITMWEPKFDVLGADHGSFTRGGLASKDIPCNTQIYFKIRDGALRMTVCNRSNDLLWGAYGANAVHMSILQSYIAGKLGRRPGTYTQMSDSLHVYTGGEGGKVWDRVKKSIKSPYMRQPYDWRFRFGLHAGAQFDADLVSFFDNWKDIHGINFHSLWWKEIAIPMWRAYEARDPEILKSTDAYKEEFDWPVAGARWLERHPKK